MARNPKLSRSDLELLSLSFAPSSFVIVPFFQAATLISPMINLAIMLIKRIAITIAAMILNAPILFSLGRMAFKSSRRSGCLSLSSALPKTAAAPERAPVGSSTRAGLS